MRNLKSSILISTITLLTVPTLMFGAGKPAGGQLPPPKADVYIVPEATDLPIDLKYPAQIKSYQKANVYSRVIGVLEKHHFNEGEKVNKGDLLFKIEDTIYQAKVDAAKASLEMSQATLNNATRNWERIKKLYKSRSVSDEQRDTALSSYETAVSALALAKAQLHQAKIDLDYTNVKAPISGFTGMKKVDIGNLVSNAPSTELLTITQNDKVYLDFSMPLSDYKNIKENLWSMPEDGKINVAITLDGKPMKESGVVDFIDANIDQKTSTVKMRALVQNSEHNLIPGSFIRITLQGIVQKNVITIPQKALLQNPMGTIVFVEKEGKAAVRPVMIGKESGSNYIVAGGMVQSGDKVIVNNFFRVKPGQPLIVDKVINQ